MRALGISAFYHDSAAALVDGERIVAAAQEERFTRKKHDSSFPKHAIEYCLKEAGVSLNELDSVVFYDKPFLKFERLIETYLEMAPRGFKSFRMAIPVWLREKLFQKSLLRKELKQFGDDFDWQNKLLFCEHHLSHAASAFFPSPYDEAVVLTMDGVGEWATTSAAMGKGNHLEMFQEIHFPHSLGLLYSAFTYYTGFKVNSGEYKVMGLAPYGEPKYVDVILDNLIDLKPDGSFRLDMSYFDYCTGLTMTNERFAELFGQPVRSAEKLLTPFHMDIAASIQVVLEEAVLRMARALKQQTGARNLCLAGGVALNCVANGKILRDGAFENIWIQPAAGDAGGARRRRARRRCISTARSRATPTAGDGMAGALLGPSYEQADVEQRLGAAGANFSVLSEDAMVEAAADALASQQAVGWFQGRMEFGRARSAPARSSAIRARPVMQRISTSRSSIARASGRSRRRCCARTSPTGSSLTLTVPICCIVADVRKDRRRAMTAEEEALFGIDKLNVARSEIPAVTHVDYSARIQTVHADTNPLFHRLLTSFKRRTGCPVLVNTSFNVRGEPIVCTPEDAFRCFMGNEHRSAGGRQLRDGEGQAGSEPQAGLQLGLRAGLIAPRRVLRFR